MIAGVSVPGGDNTYSEAFSNTNAQLPPFPELRIYKYEVLKDLYDVIDGLTLHDDQKKWLKDIYKLCFEVNEKQADAVVEGGRVSPEKPIEWAERLEKLWSTCENPNETWKTLSENLQQHSMNGRLHALIKEQICLKRTPGLLVTKKSLVDSSEPIEFIKNEYHDAVEKSNNAHLERKNGPKATIN